MHYKIIPIFVTYKGCSHRCVYCNVRITAGDCPESITGERIDHTVAQYLRTVKRHDDHIQIAFYGGSFTGMSTAYQEELLNRAEYHVHKGHAESIRISTRPDYIDDRSVALLQRYSVRTVEIGAQSMVDDVLERSRRGHDSRHVRRAVGLLKRSGFETGLHLMAGLPGDTPEGFRYTVDQVIALGPHMIRIHPTVVLAGTELADMYRHGDYTPLTLSEAVSLCGDALGKFEGAGIPVIRMGLQMTDKMERKGAIVAGPHHPSFRSLVQSSLLYERTGTLLKGTGIQGRGCTFRINPQDASDFRGKGNVNIELLKQRFHLPDIRIMTDRGQTRGTVALVREETTRGGG
jgi:histone acetyltransferase (RNA polymerase elongator complex component)